MMNNIKNFINQKYRFHIGDVWVEGVLYVIDCNYGEDKPQHERFGDYPNHYYDSDKTHNLSVQKQEKNTEQTLSTVG